MKIAIIGAGIQGLWCAAMLQKKDAQITIFEAKSENMHHSCSWKAGGMLAPYCERESSEPIITKLGKHSIDIWRDYIPENITLKGTLIVANPQDYNRLEHFKSVTECYKSVGESEIASLEPDLEGRFSNGIYYPEEAHLEPRIVLNKLKDFVKNKKAVFYYNTPFNMVNSENYDAVFDCRGLSSRQFIPSYPLRGVKGEMVIIRCKDISLQRPVRLLHPRHPLYIVPRANDIYMIGATTIESDTSSEYPTLRSVGELLTQAYNLHPAFAEAEILEMNVGLRPAYPDNLPRIYLDKVSKKPYFHINGLYRHGYLIAPALAEIAVKALYENVINEEVMYENIA